MVKILLLLPIIIFYSCLSPNQIIQKEKKAIQFLSASKPDYDFIFLYKNLSDKLCWPELNHVKNYNLYEDSLKKSNDDNARKTLKNSYLYKKVFDSNHKIDSTALTDAIELNLLSLKALYCDCFKIDTATYFKELTKIGAQGEYYTTHSLLLIYWLRKYNCFNNADLVNTEKILIKHNLDMLRSSKNVWNDITIESAALLQANNYKIPVKWLKQIIKNQNEDGGWSSNSNQISSTHTTLLALWSLGEYRRKIQKKCRLSYYYF